MNREARQKILEASTVEELEKCFENVSILDLLIAGETLGINVDSISDKYLDAEWIELRNAITEVKMKTLL